MTKSRTLADSGTAFTTVSATELGYVDGVTSAIQTQIDTKAPSSTTVTLTGTQTLTNKTLTTPVLTTPSISTITTKGDILGFDTALNRVPIGANNTVLTADSAQALGLKWATPATPNTDKTFTLISTTATTSGSTVTISGLTGDTLFIHLTAVSGTSANSIISIRLNADTGTKYSRVGVTNDAGSAYSSTGTFNTNKNGIDTVTNTQLAFYSSTEASGYSGVIQILGAASTTGIKPIIIAGGSDPQGSNNAFQYVGGAVYTGTTPAAITSVSFSVSAGTFDAGSISIFKG